MKSSEFRIALFFPLLRLNLLNAFFIRAGALHVTRRSASRQLHSAIRKTFSKQRHSRRLHPIPEDGTLDLPGACMDYNSYKLMKPKCIAAFALGIFLVSVYASGV